MAATKLNFLCELFSSSSESSDEEMDEVVLQYIQELKEPTTIKNFIQNVVNIYSDIEFKKNFRLNRTTAYKLIEDFQRSHFYPKNTFGKEHVSAEKHILAFLWYAGNKTVMRVVHQLFDVGLSTLENMFDRVINYLINIAPRVIVFPQTEEQLVAMSDSFEQVSGFPHVIGCIDGTYINIQAPAKKIKSTYCNRHHRTALTLQGICDPKKRFTDIFTGVSAKIHDSRIFSLSFIKERLPEICGDTYHLLGDSGYNIQPFLLIPFRDYGNLTPEQRHFNYKLSATRVLIENTFQLLKSRFRQLLLQLDFHTVEKNSKFIVACCVLHNLCIDCGDVWEELEDGDNNLPHIDEGHNENIVRAHNELSQLGVQKRNYITTLLFSKKHC